MIALADTSFVRHAESALALRLFRPFRESLGWEFVVPEAVLAELARRRVPPELAAFLADGTARAGRCGGPRGPRMEGLLRRMGDGEAEAVCIVDECEDRTFKRYLILTDDMAAQARARRLGMSSLETMGFLEKANREGLISAGEAAAALGALEASGYHVGAARRSDFARRLV